MGLLDGALDNDMTRFGLGLLAASGPTNDPMKGAFGSRLMQAVGSFDDYRQQKAQQERAKRQEEFQAFQMEQMKAQAMQQAAEMKRRETIQQGMGKFVKPGQQALAPLMGDAETGILPSAGRAAVAPSFDAGGAAQFLAQNGAYEQALPMLQSLQPKERTLSPGQVVFQGNQKILEVPKEATTPAELQGYQYAKQQGYPGSYLDYQKEIKRAGASSVSVNTDNLGLKPKDRFDMEDKMRADYSKATGNDSEIINTAQDLRNILKQGGALKDQAAIYKFAKSLDPQGAVREADYAAIVQTAGGLDYVTALANKALTGEQLSPKQRTEMANLMDSMASVAKTRIAKNQQRFGANAKMYNLKPENIFQQQTEGDGWAILPGGK